MRIGLIGLGSAGLRHAQAVRRSREATIVAAADPSPTAARAAEELAIPCLPEPAHLFERFGLDAVIVSVPHAHLSTITITALRRGLHVLLEKPMATTLADARAIVTATQDAGVCLMVNFVHRFREEYRKAFELIRSGTIGEPTLIVDAIASGYSALPDWVWRPELSGGGMMMYNGVHGIDRIAWLMGRPIVEVSARLDARGYPGPLEDSATAQVVFQGGGLGVAIQHKSRASATLSGWHTLIYGTRGGIKVVSGAGLEVAAEDGSFTLDVPDTDRFLEAFREFVRAVRERRTPTPSATDGLRALEAVLAVYQSARERRGVLLPVSDLEPPG